MKFNISYWFLSAFLTFPVFTACTDLSETVYSEVMSENYYQSKDDIIAAVFRPFEHLFVSDVYTHEKEELSGDQLITCTRGTWWYDSGRWERYHYHNFDDIAAGTDYTNEWQNQYTGIGQCNLVLDDLNRLNPADYGLTETEFEEFKGQLRCMRAYSYIKLLNAHRYCVLAVSSDPAINGLPENRKQVEPKVLFDFIESELEYCLGALPTKKGSEGPGQQQGLLTKGAAAAMLVRLYLNAEVWIGEERWDECIAMCERIENGEFGNYSLAEEWYEPFDWDNETCNEVIFAYPASYSTTSWNLQNNYRTIYGRGLPSGCEYYLDIAQDGARNPKYALSPTYDNSYPRQELGYSLGKVTSKFAKYPGDKRFRQYRNTSVNTREGMFFLEGYIPGQDGKNAKEPISGAYEIYLLDQVGRFEGGAPSGKIPEGRPKESTLGNGDFNSGLYVVKYPFYPFSGGYYIESDHVNFRYAEIIYSHAECLLRKGDAMEAGRLLNSVRARNYEDFNSAIAYEPEGAVKLDMAEMLDEWGREFLAESRRRTDLIRFGRFQEAWWDKPEDKSEHYEIFPINQEDLAQNKYLKQVPGYQDIR